MHADSLFIIHYHHEEVVGNKLHTVYTVYIYTVYIIYGRTERGACFVYKNINVRYMFNQIVQNLVVNTDRNNKVLIKL